MPGTSAQLQVGDSLTVEELLYALMLPSGNDAAVALADNLGRVIIKNKKRPCKVPTTKVFISHMNTLYR
jgi:D-alanyl-D-alanine carboxypeptidase